MQWDSLTLVACCLLLDAQLIKKVFTAPEIGIRQLVMRPDEIVC
jgi:hypothetical protein